MTTSAHRKLDPSRPLNFENPQLSYLRSALDSFTFYGLLLIVIAAAVPYAEVDSPFQLIYASLIYLLSGSRAVHSLLRGSFTFADKTLLAPILGLLILTMVQVVPLSLPAWFRDSGGAGSGYISLDQYATVSFLLILGSLTVLGETLLNLTNTRKRLIAVTAAVLVIGIGSALFGVCRQALMGAEDNMPLGLADIAGAQYAQFINRNHFALLIEMTLGVLLGLILKGRLSLRWKVAVWIMVALCWFAIISANSRGGIISAAVVIVLAVSIHFVTRTTRIKSGAKRRSPRLKPILATTVLIALLSAALIMSVAFIGGDTIVSRFEKTDREFVVADNGSASRMEIWQSTIRLIAAFPVTGSGFGAYGRAITPYDTASTKQQVVQQAHNEYLEIVAGGGAIAALLTLLFLGVIVRRVIQRFKDRGKLGKAICFGAAVGISGVLLHSFVDFGLHVQINSLVFVLLIVLATASVERSRPVQSRD
jgi:O-antigen ligase